MKVHVNHYVLHSYFFSFILNEKKTNVKRKSRPPLPPLNQCQPTNYVLNLCLSVCLAVTVQVHSEKQRFISLEFQPLLFRIYSKQSKNRIQKMNRNILTAFLTIVSVCRAATLKKSHVFWFWRLTDWLPRGISALQISGYFFLLLLFFFIHINLFPIDEILWNSIEVPVIHFVTKRFCGCRMFLARNFPIIFHVVGHKPFKSQSILNIYLHLVLR